MKKITFFLAILSIAILIYGIITTKEISKTFEINNMNESVKIISFINNGNNMLKLTTSKTSIHIYNDYKIQFCAISLKSDT